MMQRCRNRNLLMALSGVLLVLAVSNLYQRANNRPPDPEKREPLSQHDVGDPPTEWKQTSGHVEAGNGDGTGSDATNKATPVARGQKPAERPEQHQYTEPSPTGPDDNVRQSGAQRSSKQTEAQPPTLMPVATTKTRNRVGDQTKSDELYSEKWIVITTIQLPTDAVRTMAAQKGWSVVAVGDKKTPSNWHLDNCVFLSVQQQAKLGFKVHNFIPYKHYGRKNIGYLYAIKHGAKIIYDTDDDNELIVDDLDEAFLLDLSGTSVTERNMLVFQRQERYLSVVNPYVHFGQPNLWPRGYPLGAITSPRKNRYRRAPTHLKPYVQQGLANGDPDVDAIFRVTRKRSGAKIDLTFDRDAPPVALAPGQISPYNTQNTLIHKEAFWGLLVPVTTTFRVCDIWRGYWVQRVLWEIGGSLSFHPPSVYQDRNEHNYFLDHVDEFPLYNDSSRLSQFLLDWQPPTGNLFTKVRHLSRKMAAGGFWKKGDVNLLDAWLTDLEAIGYKAPPLVERTDLLNLSTSPVDYEPESLPSPHTRSP